MLMEKKAQTSASEGINTPQAVELHDPERHVDVTVAEEKRAGADWRRAAGGKAVPCLGGVPRQP